MENRSPYILVGAAVILFVFGIVGFLIWKLGAGDRTAYAYYRIFFPGEVQGLTPDSLVFYRGIKVGKVISVALSDSVEETRAIVSAASSGCAYPPPQQKAPGEPGSRAELQKERVLVIVAIERKIDVRTSTRASLEKPLIAGAAFIQIRSKDFEAGDDDNICDKRAQSDKGLPIIRPEGSFFSEAQVSLNTLMRKLGDTVDRVNAALDEESLKNIARILKNVEHVTAALADDDKGLDKTLAELRNLGGDLRKTAQTADKAIDDLRREYTAVAENARRLLADIGPQSAADKQDLAGRDPSAVRKTLEQLQASLKRLDGATGTFEALVAENRRPIRQFTDTGLVELSSMIREVRGLTTNLNIIATKLERDPAGYIFSGKQGYTPR